MASDSQGTDLEARVRVEVESKIFRLGSNIAWAVSGPEGIQQVLKESLDAAAKATWPKKSLTQIRQTIVNKVTGRQQEAVQQFVPANPNDNPPAASVLVCGYTNNKWLLEVTAKGTQQEHFKFCAIGSGKQAAYNIWESLRHYVPLDESIEFSKFIAYRILHDAITTESALVGFPIRIWTIKKVGVAELTEPEMGALGQTVEAWKNDERRSLRRVLEGQAEAGA